MKAVITSNPYRDYDLQYAQKARDILLAGGVDVSICFAFDAELENPLPETVKLEDLETELKHADVMICFGGDGTLLHASKAATFHGVPVLGVNIGNMGFMAELEATQLNKLIELINKPIVYETRMMLDVSVERDGKRLFHEHALNDAVITKGAVARIIQLDLLCDNVSAMSFGGDGIIVCTPTGSTAYSMSAGGPIVEPSAENIIVTPVCAHSMLARPLVLAGSRQVSIRVGRTGKRNAFLSVDGGRSFRLNTGDLLQIRRSRHVTKLVQLSEKSFFEVLQTKLI